MGTFCKQITHLFFADKIFLKKSEKSET